VLADLNAQMKAGKIPGWTSVHQFFRDGIHLNEPGSYAVACTYFATLLKKSPVDLPTASYGTIAPDLARTIQQTAWRVVRSRSDSGVAADRPPQASP
jgi:phage head maturation protease